MLPASYNSSMYQVFMSSHIAKKHVMAKKQRPNVDKSDVYFMIRYISDEMEQWLRNLKNNNSDHRWYVVISLLRQAICSRHYCIVSI